MGTYQFRASKIKLFVVGLISTVGITHRFGFERALRNCAETFMAGFCILGGRRRVRKGNGERGGGFHVGFCYGLYVVCS